MSFINDIKEKIHEYNKGRALENKLEEIRNIHREFVTDKMELVTDGRMTYYAWVEGNKRDSYKFDFLYILKPIQQIENEITKDNYKEKSYPYDFCDKYAYDDVEYIYTQDQDNEFGIAMDTFVIKTKNKKVSMRQVQRYFHSPLTPKYCKNIFFDPLFVNEYKKWKESFLPDEYIEVKLDSADKAMHPNSHQFLDAIGYNGKTYWIWKDNDSIVVMPKVPHIGIAKGWYDFEKFDSSIIDRFKMDDVICFLTLGDIEVLQTISGGEIYGGGTDFAKALKGGLLFGAVGAIINSREEIKSTPLKIDYSKIDKRTIRLVTSSKFYNFWPDKAKIYKSGECKEASAIDAFSTIIPEKGYEYLSKKGKKKETLDSIDKIEKLSELMKKGVITETEFNAKKKELLEEI